MTNHLFWPVWQRWSVCPWWGLTCNSPELCRMHPLNSKLADLLMWFSSKGWMLLGLAFPSALLVLVALRRAQIKNGHWAKMIIAYLREVSHWKSSESISWVDPSAATPRPMLLLQPKTPRALLTLEYMWLKLPAASAKDWIQVLASKEKGEGIPNGLLYFLNWHAYSDNQTVSDYLLRPKFLLLLEKYLLNLRWSLARLESSTKQLLHFKQIMCKRKVALDCIWMLFFYC